MNNEEIKNKIAELEKSDDIRDLFLAMNLIHHQRLVKYEYEYL